MRDRMDSGILFQTDGACSITNSSNCWFGWIHTRELTWLEISQYHCNLSLSVTLYLSLTTADSKQHRSINSKTDLCLQCSDGWLGSRKGIRPVKNRVVGCWRGYLSGARCRLAYGPADATATHCLLLQQNPDWFYLSGTGSPG